MVRFPQKRFIFGKIRGNRFSGSGGQNHRKLILKISTINLHGAGKLKRAKKKIGTFYRQNKSFSLPRQV